MYVHTHTYTHTHPPTHTNAHTHTHLHIHTHAHTHTHLHIHTRTHTHRYKYHLKSLRDTFSKNTCEGEYLRRSYKAINNLFRDSHTQIPHHVATSRLNFDKIQITGFRKTRDKRARNLRTGSNNKSKQK